MDILVGSYIKKKKKVENYENKTYKTIYNIKHCFIPKHFIINRAQRMLAG